MWTYSDRAGFCVRDNLLEPRPHLWVTVCFGGSRLGAIADFAYRRRERPFRATPSWADLRSVPTGWMRFVSEFGPNMRSGHGRAIGKNHSYMQQYLSLIGTGRRTSAWRRASRSPSSLGYQNENCGHQDRRVRIIVVLITASDPAHAPVISFGSPHGIGDHKRVALRGSLRMRVDRRKLSLA